MAHSIDNLLRKQVNAELRQIARSSRKELIAKKAAKKREKLKTKRTEFFNSVAPMFGLLELLRQ